VGVGGTVAAKDGAPGAGRGVVGDVIVKVAGPEVPAELDTLTTAAPGKAVSEEVMAAVSCVALTKVVARGVPFQFTFDALSKFEPVTVSVIPAGLQYGVEDADVVEADSEVTTGSAPRVGLMMKFTTLETSVVVVAVVPEAPETAEPGICTAIGTVAAVAIYEAGTGAVTWEALTNVVVSAISFGPAFHRT
jgi:hypothetical protein